MFTARLQEFINALETAQKAFCTARAFQEDQELQLSVGLSAAVPKPDASCTPDYIDVELVYCRNDINNSVTGDPDTSEASLQQLISALQTAKERLQTAQKVHQAAHEVLHALEEIFQELELTQEDIQDVDEVQKAREHLQAAEQNLHLAQEVHQTAHKTLKAKLSSIEASSLRLDCTKAYYTHSRHGSNISDPRATELTRHSANPELATACTVEHIASLLDATYPGNFTRHKCKLNLLYDAI